MEEGQANQLTARQRQLLMLVANGVTKSKALAEKTGIAPGTVDNSLATAAKILGATNRSAAAARFAELMENSHEASHVRTNPLSYSPQSVPSGSASTSRRILGPLIDFLRGPPLGGEEHSLRWDQVALQILRVAVIGILTISALVLVVLGFFKTFG